MRSRLRRLAEHAAVRLGWRLSRLTAEERRYLRPSHADSAPLPEAVAQRLRANHPELLDLRRRYAAVDLPVTQRSLWSEALLATDLDLRHFRGDNPYVWQLRTLRGQAHLKYYLYLRYVESCDSQRLLPRLEEDGAFGCWTFDYARRTMVSRDLLDSVNELNFLERHLQLSQREALRIVDIGAGYGRLAHRACEALDNLAAYYCLDAIPESTYLCDFYLGYRGCTPRAQSVPLDAIDARIPDEGIDVAVNIHSFSECTHDAVWWWLQWLARRKVRHLLIVPNDPNALLTMERDGTRRDFSDALAGAGYRLALREAVLNDADIRGFTGIGDHFYLFER